MTARLAGFDGTMTACRKRAAKVMPFPTVQARHYAKVWEATAVSRDFKWRAIGCGPSRREALRVLFAALEAMGELP